MATTTTNESSSRAVFSHDFACDLCGEREVELLATRDRRSQPLRTVVCRCCGLISHETIPSDDELANYYTLQYRHDYHGERQPSAKRVLRAWHAGQSIYRRMQPFVRRDDELFEVGAGLGCTLKAFELGGYRASGIDPGAGFQAYSRDVLGTRIENAALEEMPPVPSYDFILLAHVIEHFNRPARALRRIRSLLRPGGRLYVECPNVFAPHAAPRRLFHFAHIYNFTPWTLKMLGESCGLKTIRRISGQRDTNLMFVFERSESRQLIIDPDSYRRSLEAVRRYNTLTYHVRPRYAIGRIQSLYRLLNSAWLARWRTRRLVNEIGQCREMTTSNEPAFQRKTA